MAQVAVTHPQFALSGGAEAVALNILEAIQDEHDVTLLTTKPVDLDYQNKYHGTNVAEVEVHCPRLFDGFGEIVGDRFGILRYALLNRHVQRREEEYDLVISSFNEFESDNPCICYFHHPMYDRSGLEHDVQSNNLVRRAYKRLAAEVAGVSARSFRSTINLSNSDWTGAMVEHLYGTKPKTLYPPVDVSDFSGATGGGRENGFVSIGRIAPDKNVLRNIEIVSRLREQGHDVHLHLVGPVQRSGYFERVKALADPSFVSIEGQVARERLIELVQTHRYGLHGKEYEHFGIVIVEMIAGGMLPFLPATGGQTEIVENDSRVLYESTEDAVKKADRVLSDDRVERELRDAFVGLTERYSRDRFQTLFQEVVERTLS
jgi:glycosyltransferase involved in cell wall biosynthesis